MAADPTDALVEAARDGVDVDGLAASADGDTYFLSVPGHTYEGLSETGFREAAASHEDAVAEWYFWQREAPRAPGHRAFLRWVEGAERRTPAERRAALQDGVSRTWGELWICATADDRGRRTYEVRHASDAGEPLAALSTHSDPAAVPAVARRDDRGRYRPLSAAPTLRTGWAFVDLDPEAVVRTVEGFYPATIANWHREREGELDVTHWREAAARQTGMYDVVAEVEGRQVAWLAEACCVDSQCLKRREWDESDEEPLGVPRGDGEFPCREPCSLAIATAREIALGERNADEPDGPVPTDAEAAQLERILGAVADGEAGEVGEGDVGDPANRYRVRYLRAKLAETGRLGSTDG